MPKRQPVEAEEPNRYANLFISIFYGREATRDQRKAALVKEFIARGDDQALLQEFKTFTGHLRIQLENNERNAASGALPKHVLLTMNQDTQEVNGLLFESLDEAFSRDEGNEEHTAVLHECLDDTVKLMADLTRQRSRLHPARGDNRNNIFAAIIASDVTRAGKVNALAEVLKTHQDMKDFEEYTDQLKTRVERAAPFITALIDNDHTIALVPEFRKAAEAAPRKMPENFTEVAIASGKLMTALGERGESLDAMRHTTHATDDVCMILCLALERAGRMDKLHELDRTIIVQVEQQAETLRAAKVFSNILIENVGRNLAAATHRPVWRPQTSAHHP